MNRVAWLVEELKAVGVTTALFAAWFLLLMLMQSLILKEYGIEFFAVSSVFIGALIVAKVVLVLEHVSLGSWIERRPAWVDVLVRTALYGLGVLAVFLLETAFESRHERGGFLPALVQIVDHPKLPQLLAAAIGVSLGLLVFNATGVMRRHLGEDGVRRLFRVPMPEPPKKER